MYALFVTVQIKPDKREAFLKAAFDDARGSVSNEPGCLRFDVIEDGKDPDRFHFYEVYRDKSAFEAHTKMPHLLKYREATKDLMAAPMAVQRGPTLFPPDAAWQKNPL